MRGWVIADAYLRQSKCRLGLDKEGSWIVVSEVNRFAWPGSDPRPVAAAHLDDGHSPPALFQQVPRRPAEDRTADRRRVAETGRLARSRDTFTNIP